MSFVHARKTSPHRSRRPLARGLPQNFSNNATLNLLRRFEPMASLDWHSLATLSRLANEIVVPAKRLLIRPPRRLDGVWYLCSGTVYNEQTGERLVAGSPRCRTPIYPGQASLRCVSAVRLLYFDDSAAGLFGLFGESSVGLVGGEKRCDPSLAAVASDPALWLETLAASPVLRLLYRRRGASGWQHWLRELESLPVKAGQQVIAPGVVGECFYVIQSGVALIEDAGAAKPLAHVVAGGFFGEDAVLTGKPRNARVHMPGGGRVLRGSSDQLHALVADLWWSLARAPESWGDGGIPLQFAAALHPPDLRSRIATLAKNELYGLSVAQDNGALSLAMLLLVHRGYRVLLRDAGDCEVIGDVPDSETVMQTL